jgi:predicted O-methyltransferase YrrM
MPQRWAQHTTARAIRPVLTVLDRRIERLARRRARQVLSESKDVLDLRSELLQLRTELENLRRQAQAPGYAVDLLLGAQGRRSTRLISESRLRDLAAQVAAVSQAPDAYGRVVQAYRTLFELELRGVGRMAGAPGNVLGKLATTPLLNPPNGQILEIGTLFGMFSGGMVRQISRAGLTYGLTVVDPLEDPEEKSTETVVRENLSLAGVDPRRMRLVRGAFADPEVQARVADREYGVIILDGDHSAPAVAADLRFAEQIAAPGGIVLLDDYTDRNWPGVQEATDSYLTGDTRLEFLGVVATTAFLRAQPAPATIVLPEAGSEARSEVSAEVSAARSRTGRAPAGNRLPRPR